MICVPLRAKSEKELIALIKKAEKKGAQAVEIWLDHLKTLRGAGDCVARELREIQDNMASGSETSKTKRNTLAAIRKATKLPLIFVNKPKREKGKWNGTEHSRIEILKNAIAHGADYIDIGIDTNPESIRSVKRACSKNGRQSATEDKPAPKRQSVSQNALRNDAKNSTKQKRPIAKLIMSYHDFTDTPRLATLKYIFKKMRVYKPDVYKFAVMPKNPKDVVRMLEFLGWIRDALGTGSSMRLDAGQGSKLGAGQIRADDSHRKGHAKYVIICMGRYGEFLRQISENLGNAFTYVALDAKHKTAPGQQILG